MLESPASQSQNESPQVRVRRLPAWLKRPMPSGDFSNTRAAIAASGIATVCREARCPNLSECWSNCRATFMILGDKCTRRCHYCAVTTARPDSPAEDEPQRLADVVSKLGLRHVVLTAVARDDLEDEGAGHFARCVTAIHEKSPTVTVEVLPSDFHARPEHVKTLCDAGPELYNHNIETVESITPKIRPQADYRRSLEVLRIVKKIAPHIITKSGLMVGLGESPAEIHQTLADLCSAGCEVVTIGQYLQPTLEHHVPTARYYTPEEFDEIGARARSLGFVSVASGPFVRSSYHAAEVFEESKRRLNGMPESRATQRRT